MQLGFYFDQTRCVGCLTCVVACKDWHDIPAGPANWVEGECIEAVPVDIQYDFSIEGKHMEVPMSDVNPEVMMMYPDLVSGDNFKVFEIQFANPEVTKIDIPPFANCWPDADQEFVNSLGTYWINVIPFISPEFRTVPAGEGYTCPGVLSFNEEGLGSLEACYNIFLP